MKPLTIQVCTGNSCTERFSSYIIDRIHRDIDFYKYTDVIVEAVPCQGRCKEGPTVVIDHEKQTRQNPIRTSELLRQKITAWKTGNHSSKKTKKYYKKHS